ncbi:MAG: hypothetical protein ABL940_13630 [Bacteroidia bacterium]
MKYYLFIIILSFVHISTINACEPKQDEVCIELKKNIRKGKATLLLKINNKVVDKMVIKDLDFEINTLNQINDSLWQYIYSYGASKTHSVRLSRQLLLRKLNNKIHISYISLYQFILGNNLYNEDSSLYYSEEKIHLELKNLTHPTAKYYDYTKKIYGTINQIDSSSKTVLLKYDSINKVYYTDNGLRNGYYDYSLKEPKNCEYKSYDEIIYIDNVLGKYLKIQTNLDYFYYNNKWFSIQTYPYDRKRMTQIFPDPR